MDWGIMNTPDTLRILITGFVSMAWGIPFEYPVLGLIDLSNGQGSYNPGEILLTIWLLSCDQLHVQLSHNRFLGSVRGVVVQFELMKLKFED